MAGRRPARTRRPGPQASFDPPLMLRIRVLDIRHVSDLLEHLRAFGCIAYTSGDGVVHALLPEVPWREEDSRIRAVVETWVSERGVELVVEPLDP
jgi:hypothetical protein